MILEELRARLNDAGYKNWLKAGCCLLALKGALHDFLDSEMKRFHDAAVRGHAALGRARCRSTCRPTGNQLRSACRVCSKWMQEILKHHTSPAAVVNWGNCRPWLWPSEHWEVAKAFMPRGQTDVTRAEQCDAAALLNLLHFCDHFSFIDQSLVKEVIRSRNELMHSCEMRVSAQWMERYQKSIKKLLLQLCHIPAAAAANQQIQEMLSVDWSVHIPGVDAVDGSQETRLEPEYISQWETELIREQICEILTQFDEEESIGVQDLESLQHLCSFLQNHADLKDQFKTEIDRICCTREKLQSKTPGEDVRHQH
ncbi:uncharacterized protein CXorf38-like [Denticeps clupeoides]|uniref:Uncharacterized protein n=1 Tax=Denticeps clupeoides TaxID=299321 RepID=A0AAY4AR13_9TELE|nr:uncharacterized protein CXorf38-like [Denticeps clupeoides]